MDSREHGQVPTMSDLLALPDDRCRLLVWILRRRSATLKELVAHFGRGEENACLVLAELGRAGFLETSEMDGELRYRVRVAVRPGRSPEVWQIMSDLEES